jgi:hypothetical protein
VFRELISVGLFVVLRVTKKFLFKYKKWYLSAWHSVKYVLNIFKIAQVRKPYRTVTSFPLILSRVRGSVTNNNGFWIGWLDLLAPSLQSLLNTTNCNSSQSMTAQDSLHADWTASVLSSAWLTSFWFTSHSLLVYEWTTNHWGQLTYEWMRQSQCYFTTCGLPPISSSWRQALETHDRRSVFQLGPCSNSPYVTSFLTRRWVCLLWICLAFRQAIECESSRVLCYDRQSVGQSVLE